MPDMKISPKFLCDTISNEFGYPTSWLLMLHFDGHVSSEKFSLYDASKRDWTVK